MPGNKLLMEMYPEFEEKVYETRQKIQRMEITIRRGQWHDPSGFISPTPIKLTCGQHFLKHYRTLLPTEEVAILLHFSTMECERKVVITDLIRHLNVKNMALMKHRQQQREREENNITPTPMSFNQTSLMSSRRLPSPSTTSFPTSWRLLTPSTSSRRSPSTRRPNPLPDLTPDRKQNKKSKRNFSSYNFFYKK